MRQTLFYIPATIAGIPLFGVGIIFGLIVLTTVAILISHYSRRQKGSEYLSTLTMGAVASGLVVYVIPKVALSQGFPVRGYGVFLMLAILLASALVIWRGKRLWNLPPEMLLSTVMVSVITGIIGARLFHVIEYWDNISTGDIRGTMANIVDVTGGGLVVYGSIIGGSIGMFVYMYWKKIPMLGTFDLFAPALMLGIAIGRIGCLMNGCCFGAICDHLIGITFPPGSPAHIHQWEHGDSAPADIFLEPIKAADQSNATVFGIKESATTCWTNTPSKVVIQSVEPNSPAGKAGLCKGLEIVELERTATIPAQKTAVKSNADFFNFFYDQISYPDEPVGVVCRVPGESQTTVSRLERFTFIPGSPVIRPVFPTQIISAINAFLLCLILLGISRYCKRDGTVFALMFLLYAMNRFILELFRSDEASFLHSGLTISQCISVVVFLFATALLIAISRRSAERALTKYKVLEN